MLETTKWLPRVLKAALGGPLGPTLPLLRDSWGAAGDSWGALGALWALWDRSWGGLGALMGRSWALRSALGRYRALPGRFWHDFSSPELDFGPETIKLGAIRGGR